MEQILVRALAGACLLLISYPGIGQESSRWNFTMGGGVGFPEGTSAHFVNNGADFVVGGAEPLALARSGC